MIPKLSALALLVAAPFALAQPQPALKPRPAAPEGVEIQRDINYLPEGRTEQADLYLPAKRGKDVKSPAVLIIHGGGWTGGTKNAEREFNIGTTLALNGYVGFSIDYVLATKDKPTWPQNLYDCKTAVRWLRKNAERLQIDPENIGVIGGSAGGHLAAMVGLTGPDDKLDPAEPDGKISCRVKCAVDLYGPGDLTVLKDLEMIGKPLAEAPELYKAASPVTYADMNDPPILLLHGTADKIVDVKQSENFAEALKKAGTKHQLVVIPDAPHTFHLQPKQRDLRPLVIGFFDEHLKPKK
jgi:acetyl esterase/lipase